jgi:hypothetical protein
MQPNAYTVFPKLLPCCMEGKVMFLVYEIETMPRTVISQYKEADQHDSLF